MLFAYEKAIKLAWKERLKILIELKIHEIIKNRFYFMSWYLKTTFFYYNTNTARRISINVSVNAVTVLAFSNLT